VTNILLPQAAHWTSPGSFALCESEAAATNVFCSESEAAATNVFCSESEATATNVFCSESEATATKRPVGTEINPSFCRRALLYLIFTLINRPKRPVRKQ